MKSYEPLKKIGENIRNIRKEKGLKGEALAKELGVTKQAVSQMELGLIDFKISTLNQIASALNEDIVGLIKGTQSLEVEFADYRYKIEQHLSTISKLVCQIEYLNKQIEVMRREKQSNEG